MQNFEEGHYFIQNFSIFKFEISKILYKIVSFFKILHVKKLFFRLQSQITSNDFSVLYRDVAVAGVLVGIILVFLVCHSFKFIVNIYETYISNTGESSHLKSDAKKKIMLIHTLRRVRTERGRSVESPPPGQFEFFTTSYRYFNKFPNS